MKKQVYSTPKTRLVTMTENVAIMAASGKTVTDVVAPGTDISFGGGSNNDPNPTPGGRVHGYTGRFMDFN